MCVGSRTERLEASEQKWFKYKFAKEFIALELDKDFWEVWWSIPMKLGAVEFRAYCGSKHDGLVEAHFAASKFGVKLPELVTKSKLRIVR